MNEKLILKVDPFEMEKNGGGKALKKPLSHIDLESGFALVYIYIPFSKGLNMYS